MSYGFLRHDNRSSPAVNLRGGDADFSRKRHRKLDSDDEDDDDDIAGNGESQDAFELKDLSVGTRSLHLEDGIECLTDELQSDEDEAMYSDKPRHSSVSTTQSFMLYTPDEERAVIKKFDRKLVLFVAFLYMLSFLDRSNIGNAKIAGLSRDLDLSDPQFEWLLRAFYITYIAFEWMTLLWKILPPHIYLAICVASWGIIASLQSLSFSFWSLLVLRASLGIGEAAFVGIPFYMSFFYKRDELAFRTGLFISAAPLAISFAGSLAWLITRFGDYIPIASWRVLFLLEGFPSVIVAIFVYMHIPDRPDTARYLTQRERRVAKLRLRKENDASRQVSEKRGLRWKEIGQTLIDPKSYLTAAMFFCCNVAFASLPVFLPTIIEEIGFTPLTSQALTFPPYLIAFLTVLLTAYLSDRHRTRSTYVIIHALLASSGYTLMAVTGATHCGPFWRYIGVFPATMGFFSAITIIITWTMNNQASEEGRGAGMAVLNYVGQLGPLLGVQLYPEGDGPYYVKGMGVCAGAMGVVAVLAVGLRWVLRRENARVVGGGEEEEGAWEGEDEGLVGEGRRRKMRERFVYML